MQNRILDIFKKYNDAGLNLPTLLAVLPLITTALITLRVSYGDITQATYIVGELGLIQVWTQGVGSLLVNTVPFAITTLMLYLVRQGKRHPLMYFSALLLLGLVYFVASIATIILAIVFIFIFDPLYDKHLDKSLAKDDKQFKHKIEKISAELKNANSRDKLESVDQELDALKDEYSLEKQKLNTSMRASAFLVGCLVLIQIVLSYPTIPQTTLILKGGHKITGLVMKRDDNRVMIYDQKSKAVEMAYIDSIQTEDVCAPRMQTSLYGFGWSFSRLTLESQGRASVPYAMCK